MKVFRQYDSRWNKLKYPKKCTVGGSGCALVGLTNLLIEYPKYKDATPKTFYSYMKQFSVDGDGTKRAGVATALAHYGLKDIQRFQNRPISEAWKLLAKGYRGLFVMSSVRGGSKRTLWTTTGHYIAIVDYKYKNGKHYLLCKDSGARKHDGWYTYEEHMRGAVSDCIIGDCTNLKAKPTNDTSSKKKAVYKATDGLWGKEVTLLAQKKLGTPQDGVISGQFEANKKYHKVMDSESWKYGKGGSILIGAIQKVLGLSTTGHFDEKTIKALQKALGVTVDGYFGKQSLEAFKKYLNGTLTLKITHELTDGEKIGRLANDCAYATDCASAKYPGGKIKSEYKVALNKAYPNRKSWGEAPRAGASCDVFVGTCIVASGVDKDFPRGLQDQYPHMEKSNKWQLVTKSPKQSDLKDGDIVIYSSKGTKPTHIMIYYKGTFKHAWLKNRYGRTTADVASRLKGKKWIKVYRAR